MQIIFFSLWLVIFWIVGLVFSVKTSMHFASYYKWKINKWYIGGIIVTIYILASYIFLVTIGN